MCLAAQLEELKSLEERGASITSLLMLMIQSFRIVLSLHHIMVNPLGRHDGSLQYLQLIFLVDQAFPMMNDSRKTYISTSNLHVCTSSSQQPLHLSWKQPSDFLPFY